MSLAEAMSLAASFRKTFGLRDLRISFVEYEITPFNFCSALISLFVKKINVDDTFAKCPDDIPRE